jgi:ATP-dependent Clp protease ATP-binding subunit ClpB
MYDNLTRELTIAFQEAKNVAIKNKNTSIESAHLITSILKQSDSLIVSVLIDLKSDISILNKDFQDIIDTYPSVSSNTNDNIVLARSIEPLIKSMNPIAQEFKDDFISTEVAFLALLEDKKIKKVFEQYNLNKKDVIKKIKEKRKNESVKSDGDESKRGVLDKYTTNLTEMARNGELDPVIGRDDEIRRSIQILQRRTKNNPVLIGEPGVGKTAIVEGLAQRIVNNEVPEGLKNKTIYSLNMGSLIAGASHHGELEKRLEDILKALKKMEGQFILFIDELHMIVGAGKTGSGGMDVSNLLKPDLARGKLRCVGATTLDEYRNYIEKDSALERRFQKNIIKEPTVEDTISILRGIKTKYEIHHGVRISDASLIAAAKLSDRYITDRFLPDKAIDLVDEAASLIRMEIDSKPLPLEKLDRKIKRKSIEIEALKTDVDKDFNETKIIQLSEELEILNSSYSELEEKWLLEKSSIYTEQDIKEKIEELESEKKIAYNKGEFKRVAEIASLIPNLNEKLENISTTQDVQHELLRNKVTEDEISEVVSKWTGIPVDTIVSDEAGKLLDLEKTLSDMVIGQKEAVKGVAYAVKRSRSGLAYPDKPNASFLFLGTTGVGKTELCKSLSKILFSDEDSLIRMDMSEYMEKHSVSRLIGSPPGYVGYENGGALTEAVRRKPYSIILFDEIEKAHEDVYNVLLQILDDGRLTDGQGRLVDFKNTIIIMTSNVGSENISDDISYDDIKEKVMIEVDAEFKPEFINRIDEIVVFSPLSKDDVTEIAKIQINNLKKRLLDLNLTINFSENAMSTIVDNGYNPAFGARPLKRTIQKMIENPLSDELLKGTYQDKKVIDVNLTDDKLIFS